MNPSDEKWIPREEVILAAFCDARAILSIIEFVVESDVALFGFRPCMWKVARARLVSGIEWDTGNIQGVDTRTTSTP